MRDIEALVKGLTQELLDLKSLAMKMNKQTEERSRQESKRGEDTEGAREKLFSLLKEIEEKKGKRSEILHQQDMLIEKSRMRTTELERLTHLLLQLDEKYAVKQTQFSPMVRRAYPICF